MDLFAQWIAPVEGLGVSIMKLIVALGILAAAVSGAQMLFDYITGNVMAQRQHRGQLVKIIAIVLIFGASTLVVQTITSVGAAAGG